MNHTHKILGEFILQQNISVKADTPIHVIKFERDCDILECQLWITEDSGAVISVRFLKDEWDGYLYRLDKISYCEELPASIIARFFKVVERTIVDEIDKTLMKESYAPVRGFKKYFYAHIVESKEYWLKKYFSGIKNETPTLLVYSAS